MKMRSLLAVVVVAVIAAAPSASAYQYATKTLDVLLDHFTFTDNATFALRYLVNDSFVRDSKSPLLFYTGNEGDIELFAANTGFVWSAGEQLGALVVFAEHRFYGKSLPFGNESYKDAQHLGYLSSGQALADFAQLLEVLNPNRTRPVICFGGSYGGMLSAWMRLKYPHLVVGALASSAPVRQFADVVPCDIFNRILTGVFATALSSPHCVDNLRQLWPVLQRHVASDDGRKALNARFNFCTPLNKTADFETLYAFLQDVLGNLAMANYPYEANFLAPLPAYPVREFCGQWNAKYDKDDDLLAAFNTALQVYTNYTGKTKCLDISTAYDSSMGSLGWDFQACTEMVMPMCATGTTDMFLPKKWDFKEFAGECQRKFKVTPCEGCAIAEYGAWKFDSISNVIFSNGLLDPWSGGGVLRSSNSMISVIIIPDSAHHLDLRADHKDDTKSVKWARKYYLEKFKEWIDTY